MPDVSLFSSCIDLSASGSHSADPNPVQKLLYDRKSAAHALSISVRSLDYLVANKQLRFRKAGRKVLIPHSELVRFARADHPSLSEFAQVTA